MSGDEADIMCGEWDSNGSNDPNTSGEKYNIALTIKEIVRHPDYANNTDQQSYIPNDIAIFKVDESELSQVKLKLDRLDIASVRIFPLSALAGGDRPTENIPCLSSDGAKIPNRDMLQ